MKEVVISIRSTHAYDSNNEDKLDFVTDGMYDFDPESGVCRLTYFESEVTGLPGTRTRIYLNPNEIVINRDGTLTSRMEFREKERHSFLYETPYGSATMGIRTRKIHQSFNANGGSAVIDYSLDIERNPISNNRFEFSVREQSAAHPSINEIQGENV